MGPCAGVDLTLCLLQSRLQHIYHGQPCARVDLNPMSESTLSPNQGLWIWPFSTEQDSRRISQSTSTSATGKLKIQQMTFIVFSSAILFGFRVSNVGFW
jgi:hypothetical protein